MALRAARVLADLPGAARPLGRAARRRRREGGAVIVVAGHVELDPARRDEALRAASELLAATRAQTGCLDYVWCADPASGTRVWVYERWSDEPSLAAHLAGPCYRGMLAALGRGGLRGAEFAKYRIDRSGPVYDATGRPRADFFSE